METDQIKKAIRAYIIGRFKVDDSDPEFTDDVHVFEYGYVDSFGAVELIGFVEEQFGIKITQGDLVSYPLNTITEIADFVSLRKKGEL
jgi:methoxymalonate biosynthesis acyl carrier protein